jgi:hypothetical protein
MDDAAGDEANKDPDAKGRKSGNTARAAIGNRPVAVSAMLAKIKAIHGKTERQPQGVSSADKQKKVVLRGGSQKTKPGAASERQEQPKGTPEELNEIRALQAQDGNPVLKR